MDNKNKKIEIYEHLRKDILNSLSFQLDEQHKKEEKIISSIAAFKATDYNGTNKELSDITGIPKSSIQRYLTNQKLVEELTDAETFTLIKDSLLRNKQEGKVKGGINSTKKSIVVKDETGKFISSKPYKGTIDKNEQKRADIVNLAHLYLIEDSSLEKISNKEGLSRDYIYDCLTSHLVSELLGADKELELKNKLNSNYPTNMIKKK